MSVSVSFKLGSLYIATCLCNGKIHLKNKIKTRYATFHRLDENINRILIHPNCKYERERLTIRTLTHDVKKCKINTNMMKSDPLLSNNSFCGKSV
jgi:hypothetical protein